MGGLLCCDHGRGFLKSNGGGLGCGGVAGQGRRGWKPWDGDGVEKKERKDVRVGAHIGVMRGGTWPW